MRYCFIINPASGKPASKQGLEASIANAFSKLSNEVSVLYTQRAGDIGELIASFCREHSEQIRIFVCGGDGTLCEAVNGIMRLPDKDRVSLGVVPVGTGNDFVRNFENKEAFLDMAAQLKAEPMSIDLIKCNGIYAVNMINIGFDCQVVVKTSVLKKKPYIPSCLAYICGLVLTLIEKPSVKMKISVDGGAAEERELLLSTFANGAYCGGGFNSNPNARIIGGDVNSFFVKNISRTRFLSLVGSYKKGTHLTEKNLSILRDFTAKRFEIRFDKPTEVSVDGEIICVDGLKIECERSALNLLVPSGAYYKSAEAELAEALL